MKRHTSLERSSTPVRPYRRRTALAALASTTALLATACSLSESPNTEKHDTHVRVSSTLASSARLITRAAIDSPSGYVERHGVTRVIGFRQDSHDGGYVKAEFGRNTQNHELTTLSVQQRLPAGRIDTIRFTADFDDEWNVRCTTWNPHTQHSEVVGAMNEEVLYFDTPTPNVGIYREDDARELLEKLADRSKNIVWSARLDVGTPDITWYLYKVCNVDGISEA